MSNNLRLNDGDGSSYLNTENINGVHLERVKLVQGADGVDGGNVSSSNPMQVTDFWLEHALRIIDDTYGVTASVIEKKKDLFKFGRSSQVNSTNYATLMTLPTGTLDETYETGNTITHVSSSVDTDEGEMVVEGHTISGTDLTFVVQTVTLDGFVKTALTTPLARCTRLYNNTGTAWTGVVYAYEDVSATDGVPGTDAAVHCMIRAGQQQSEKASTSISSVDFWIITEMSSAVLTKTAAFADVVLESRVVGKVFRPLALLAPASGTPDRLLLSPYIIVPPNSDIRMRALGSGNIDVSGTVRGTLAITQ